MFVKRAAASLRGQLLGCEHSRPKSVDRLVGHSNEVNIVVEGRSCNALIDTGSMVSTISESMVKSLGFDLKYLEGLLRVEVAGGQLLHYLGFVEARVDLLELGHQVDALFLVVPNTVYHETVPVLIGTNLLSFCLEDSVATDISAPWRLALNCLASHKRIEAQCGSLGTVRTTRKVTVPSNERIQVLGLTRAASASCLHMSVVVEEAQRQCCQ